MGGDCGSFLYSVSPHPTHQGLQRGHDAEGDCRDDALELAHLAEEAEEAEGPQDPQLLDPAVGPAPEALVLV
jgi:hypothetical protein